MKYIKLKIHESFAEEKKYTADIISDFTGVNFIIEYHKDPYYKMTLSNGKTISIQDEFFFGLGNNNSYIEEKFIPYDISYVSYDYLNKIPVIYGSGRLDIKNEGAYLGADIFGSIFFLISRWEEAAIKDKDDHGRFPGNLSLAVKHKFIDRPVVDEYIGLLKSLIKKYDPSIEFKDHNTQIQLSCDVDSFELFTPGKTVRLFAGHLLKRHNPLLFVKDVFRYLRKLAGGKDPYDKFSEIFRLAQKTGHKPIFFILTSPEGPYNDGWFKKTGKDINIFKNLILQGAKAGLHYGYFSLLNENNIRGEKFELERKYQTGINAGRAHFLQFDIRSSFSILEKSGIKEDHSLGYSRHPGFRCGTGRAFKPWDFDNRKAYDIIERPLIVMDTTLYDHKNMSKELIIKELQHFIEVAYRNKADLNLLLHNSSPEAVFEAFEEVFNKFENYNE